MYNKGRVLSCSSPGLNQICTALFLMYLTLWGLWNVTLRYSMQIINSQISLCATPQKVRVLDVTEPPFYSFLAFHLAIQTEDNTVLSFSELEKPNNPIMSELQCPIKLHNIRNSTFLFVQKERNIYQSINTGRALRLQRLHMQRSSSTSCIHAWKPLKTQAARTNTVSWYGHPGPFSTNPSQEIPAAGLESSS